MAHWTPSGESGEARRPRIVAGLGRNVVRRSRDSERARFFSFFFFFTQNSVLLNSELHRCLHVVEGAGQNAHSVLVMRVNCLELCNLFLILLLLFIVITHQFMLETRRDIVQPS